MDVTMDQVSPRIHILGSDLVSQIAAGEVVERPAHLLKELVENSIDAGATEIEIRVRDQELLEIEVRDDGCGMRADELSLALHPHATSKIKSSDDLWKLRTFGFRGEALASISSVSCLRITSRTREMELAAYLDANFGEQSEVRETSAPVGTQIRIERLFENVPARLKFLKSKRTEAALIRQTIRAIALSHERVGLRFFYNDSLEFFYPPNQAYTQRVGVVLQFGGELSEVHFENDGWKVFSVLPDVREVAQNFKNFWVFVQNRWIQDRTIQAAVMEAHRSLLMHGEYPQGVIKIEGPLDMIDVNVHPTKSQVRFQNSGDVFRIVYRAFRDHLQKVPVDFSPPTASSGFGMELRGAGASEKLFEMRDTVYRQKKTFESIPPPAPTSGVEPGLSPVSSPAVQEAVGGEKSTGTFWSSHQLLAQMKSTYILVQGQTSCYLIDQHAAHERILYERILSHIAKKRYASQVEMIPYLLELLPEQIEFILSLKAEFAKWGVEIEEFGPRSIVIKESLSFVPIERVANSLKQLAENHMDYAGSDSFQKMIHNFAATTACHSAIRAGDVLDHFRMTELLSEMDECPFSNFCPHGRPVFIQWTWRELEVEFGRIV